MEQISQQQSNKLVLYGSLGSQPSRAVYIFLKMNKVDFEFKSVNLLKREHYSKEFRTMSPNQTIPVIVDGDNFQLFESHAILRYIHETRQIEDHWYPKDAIKRAKVNEYLDWHHNVLRQGAAGYFYRKYIQPSMGRTPVNFDKAQEEERLKVFKQALRIIESYWLLDKNKPYLIGDSITIADISCACELSNYLAIDEDYYSDYPRLNKWYKKILKMQEFKDVHDLVMPQLQKIVKKIDGQQKL